ncbi:MAG: hypothetical protein APF81_19655 [Desulfosporosinus sp. BRH_c37]|nr:MAG: hypothetical protein APF81_19655 [Desulfosporosinus sp. BRH_c37]
MPIFMVFGAINGTVTVTMSSAPATTPVIGDFVVTNGTAAVTASAIAVDTTGKVVTLTVPTIAANTTTDQSIVYNVAYKGGTAVAAPAFTIAKVAALAISTVSALNAFAESVPFAETNMVPVNALVFTANADLNASTVTTANVTVTKDTGSVAQAGAVTYDTAKKQITFTLNNNGVFATNTKFNVSITGVTDTATPAKPLTYTTSFTTGNQLVVTMDRVIGTAGNTSGTAYEFDVNKTLDAATVASMGRGMRLI